MEVVVIQQLLLVFQACRDTKDDGTKEDLKNEWTILILMTITRTTTKITMTTTTAASSIQVISLSAFKLEKSLIKISYSTVGCTSTIES